jgi:hypothetical protein
MTFQIVKLFAVCYYCVTVRSKFSKNIELSIFHQNKILFCFVLFLVFLTETQLQGLHFFRNKIPSLQICSRFWSPVIHTVLIVQIEMDFLTIFRVVYIISSGVPEALVNIIFFSCSTALLRQGLQCDFPR